MQVFKIVSHNEEGDRGQRSFGFAQDEIDSWDYIRIESITINLALYLSVQWNEHIASRRGRLDEQQILQARTQEGTG